MARTRLCIDFTTEKAAVEWFAAAFPLEDFALYRMDGFDDQNGTGGITSVNSLVVRAPGTRPDAMQVRLSHYDDSAEQKGWVWVS